MTFDPNKIYIAKNLSVEEGLAVYDVLKALITNDGDDSYYYYVDIEEDGSIKVDTVHSQQIMWLSKKLNCKPKQALISVIFYPAFYDDLQALLYRLGINNINRYEVMTDSIHEDEEWGYFFAETKEEAIDFYKNIVKVPNMITVLEYKRENDWFLGQDNEI